MSGSRLAPRGPRPGLVGILVSLMATAPAFAQGPLPATTGPSVGQTAATFELTTLEGESIRLESFRGRPLVINFFATWCDPCREEMPLVNALAQAAQGGGYEVLGIAVQDTRVAVTQYAKDGGLVFPIALDLNNRVQRAFYVYGPPATFFIDRDGVLRDRVMGPLTPERARAGLEKAGLRQ
jgi:cytochrome c biogenesis protein CcmG, thiol:disulfide interchange protein DsbE